MSVDVTDNPEHYGEIADAYFDRKMWTEALEIYYDMSENEAVRHGDQKRLRSRF